MPLDLISTLADVGTFLVISTTAIVAILQLRHARGRNQIEALSEMREAIESPDFFAAREFLQDELPSLLTQPGFAQRVSRRVLENDLQAINKVGYLFENLGTFVKYGIIDRDIACDLWADVVVSCWHSLAPVVVIRRRALTPSSLENFEYLAVLCDDWRAKHPAGAYPPGVRRMPDGAPRGNNPPSENQGPHGKV
jgi:hypothetical protein